MVGSEDGALYLLTATGRLIRDIRTKAGFSGWPVLMGNGLVAAANREGRLFFYSRDGDEQARIELGSPALGPPARGPKLLFLSTEGGRLVAVRERELAWSFQSPSPITSWPVADRQGGAYAGCQDGTLVALDERGNRRWAVRVARAAPVKAAQGAAPAKDPSLPEHPESLVGGLALLGKTLVAASRGGEILYLSVADGRVLARRQVGPVQGGVVATDRGVIVGSDAGLLRALDDRGEVLWEFAADGPIIGLPSVFPGFVIAGTTRGTLYLLDDKGQPRQLFSAAGEIHGSAVIAGSSILFGSSDRRLYSVPMPGQAARHRQETAQHRSRLAQRPQERLLWRRELSGAVARGVTAGTEGGVLASTWGRKVFRLNSDGTVRWSYNCGEDIDTLPALGSAGEVVFGCGDGGFYSLKSDGEMQYRYPVNKLMASSPALARDGTVYFGARDRRLYALDRGGKLRFRVLTGDDVDGAPRIAPDGVVYVGSDDRHLYAVDPQGHVLWHVTMAGPIRSRPAVGKDGTLYVTAYDQRLHALSRDGQTRWSVQCGGQIAGSPTVGSDGTIYFGCRDQALYAVAPDGKVRWTFATAGEVDSTPAVAADGSILVGSDDGNLYRLGPDGALVSWFRAGAEIRGDIVTRSDGTAIFGTMGGAVMAVGPPSPGGPDRPGPASTDAPSVQFRLPLGVERRGPLAPLPGGGFVVAGADGVLRAFDAEQFPLWSARLGEEPLSAPLVVGGQVFVTDSRGRLMAVADGELRFRLQVDTLPTTRPGAMLDEAGAPLILVGTRAGRLVAVTPTGKIRWFHASADAIVRPPVGLGPLAVVTSGRELVGLDSHGNPLFRLSLEAGAMAGPMVLGELVVLADGKGQILAADRSGKVRWTHRVSSPVSEMSVDARRKTMLGRLVDGRLVEVTASGEPLLQVDLPHPVTGLQPAGPHQILVTTTEHQVMLLDRGSGRATRVLDLGWPVLDIAASNENKIYIISTDGTICMIQTGRGSGASSLRSRPGLRTAP